IDAWLTANNLSVKVWYEDSGSRDIAFRRVEFLRMMKAVEAGQWDWIVVSHRDRFGTVDHLEFGKYACVIREAGCQLWSAVQGDLLAGGMGNQVLSVVDSVVSTQEQFSKSERSLRGAIEGAKQGQWQGGYPPFAFDVACVDG